MFGEREVKVIMLNANVIVNEGVYEFISFYSPHVPTQSSDLHGLLTSESLARPGAGVCCLQCRDPIQPV